MEGVQLIDLDMPVIGWETMHLNELQAWWGSVCILQAMLLQLSCRGAYTASAFSSRRGDKKRDRHKSLHIEDYEVCVAVYFSKIRPAKNCLRLQ